MLNKIIGTPDEQSGFYEMQDLDNNCGVVSQMSIINQYIDTPISEAEAVYHSMSNGWLHAGGTSPDDMGKLMDAYGIPNHQVQGASIEQLAMELQQGNRVIVIVNSAELWDNGPMGDFWNWFIDVFGLDQAEFSPADHAVVITGIDLSDEANPMVIINDSGDPEGASKTYPLKQFADAWENSNFTYVATDFPPPSATDFPSPGASDLPVDKFDVCEFLGIGAGLGYLFFTGDPVTALTIGRGIASFDDSPKAAEAVVTAAVTRAGTAVLDDYMSEEDAASTMDRLVSIEWDEILRTI